MFLREKTINGYTYLYLVESVREGARTRQRIIKNLGRKDAVLASGELDRLAASVARFAERALVLAQVESGNPDGLTCRRIGPPLLFGRLWQDTGIQAVLNRASWRPSLRVPGRTRGVRRHPAPLDGPRL